MSENHSKSSREYSDNYDRIFGKKDPTDFQKGKRYSIGSFASRRETSEREMKSMALACFNPDQQQERLAAYSTVGVKAKFHPETGELIFKGGFEAQKKLARVHGVDVK